MTFGKQYNDESSERYQQYKQVPKLVVLILEK